jgi:hypothetical protein
MLALCFAKKFCYLIHHYILLHMGMNIWMIYMLIILILLTLFHEFHLLFPRVLQNICQMQQKIWLKMRFLPV